MSSKIETMEAREYGELDEIRFEEDASSHDVQESRSEEEAGYIDAGVVGSLPEATEPGQRDWMEPLYRNAIRVGQQVKVREDSPNYFKWPKFMHVCAGRIGVVIHMDAKGILVELEEQMIYRFQEKDLEKLPYEFKPGQEVLVRDSGDSKWVKAKFQGFSYASLYPYNVYPDLPASYKYCIPYAGHEKLFDGDSQTAV